MAGKARAALAAFLALGAFWLPGAGTAGAAEAPLRAYKAARILPAEAPAVENGILLVRGRTVEKVLAAGEPVPAGADLVDLGGAVVIPALVNPISQAVISPAFLSGRRGMVSSGGVFPGDARGLRAAEAIDPRGLALRRFGRSGYGALAVPPLGGGFLGGIAAVARPRAADAREKVIIQESAYLLISFGLGQPLREMAERELQKAAQTLRKAREDREKAAREKASGKPEEAKKEEKAEKAEKKEEKAREGPPQPPQPPSPPDPLVQVFEGKLPAFVRVDSSAALLHFLRIVEKLPEPFSFVLLLPSMEPDMVTTIAERPKMIRAVVLEARLGFLPDSSVYFHPARSLREAGVEVALVPPSDDLEGHGEMPFHLAELVKGGLGSGDALRAVTSVPAKLLGAGDRVGSLLPGREASFLVFDGDPLSGRSRLLRVFLEGVEVYREDPATGKIEGEALR